MSIADREKQFARGFVLECRVFEFNIERIHVYTKDFRIKDHSHFRKSLDKLCFDVIVVNAVFISDNGE